MKTERPGKDKCLEAMGKIVALEKRLRDMEELRQKVYTEWELAASTVCEGCGGEDPAYLIWGENIIIIQGEWWEMRLQEAIKVVPAHHIK